MLRSNQTGFTLIELMTVAAIIAVLLLIGYPLYTQHILKTRRTDAETALLNLALAMEEYYSVSNTYVGANLANVGVNAYTQSDYYRLEIANVSIDSYLLSAIPQGTQISDSACGILGISQTGEKTISGNSTEKNCW